MKRKGAEKTTQSTEKHSQLTDWHWGCGLHDALILSISEKELSPNWKDKQPIRNCLEINIDCKTAYAPLNIKKISLFNYKITKLKMNESTDIGISSFNNTWWLGASLEKLSEDRSLLGVECTDLRGNLLLIEIKFSFVEIQRE